MLEAIASFFIRDTYCYTQLIVNQVYTPISMILYSHIPTAIVAIFVALFLVKRSRTFETKIFFFLAITFVAFTLGDLTEWFIFLGRGPVMYARSVIEFIDPFLFLISLYFLYVLIKKEDVKLVYKIIWLLPIIPALVMIVQGTNLIGYNWIICEAIENPTLTDYVYYVDVFYVVSALLFAVWSIIRGTGRRKEITVISIGVCSFILLFFVMEYVLTGYVFGNAFDYNYFVYAFFGMPILITFLAYLIINFKTFQTQLISVQIFVFGILSLIFFQYFFLNNIIAFILNTIALIFTALISVLLIKNIKRELKQKEELARLNIELAELIKQRENLVHLVTHKVKGAFTHSKYIFAGMLDGTFGKISAEIKKRAEQGLDSDEMGIETVDLVLNVANMQKGNIKYDMAVLDFKELVIKIILEKKPSAEAKGLVMESNIGEGNFHILGDIFWMKEVVHNLIENSIRYTKEGKITVNLERKENKILFYVKDTGVGVTPEDKVLLFTEGGRGKDSVNVNIDSTGYGLYSVKLILDAHKGKVWAESEGAGKGSTFFVELDAV